MTLIGTKPGDEVVIESAQVGKLPKGGYGFRSYSRNKNTHVLSPLEARFYEQANGGL